MSKTGFVGFTGAPDCRCRAIDCDRAGVVAGVGVAGADHAHTLRHLPVSGAQTAPIRLRGRLCGVEGGCVAKRGATLGKLCKSPGDLRWRKTA